MKNAVQVTEFDILEFNSHADFKSEKDLCDYLELNMKSFCIEDLGFELDFYKREFHVDLKKRTGRKGYAVDFLIRTKCCRNIIVECKHPSVSPVSELTKAIGQVLGYKTMFENKGVIIDQCIICSTHFSKVPYQTIQRNNLPIDIIVMNKSKVIYGSAHR